LFVTIHGLLVIAAAAPHPEAGAAGAGVREGGFGFTVGETRYYEPVPSRAKKDEPMSISLDDVSVDPVAGKLFAFRVTGFYGQDYPLSFTLDAGGSPVSFRTLDDSSFDATFDDEDIGVVRAGERFRVAVPKEHKAAYSGKGNFFLFSPGVPLLASIPVVRSAGSRDDVLKFSSYSITELAYPKYRGYVSFSNPTDTDDGWFARWRLTRKGKSHSIVVNGVPTDVQAYEFLSELTRNLDGNIVVVSSADGTIYGITMGKSSWRLTSIDRNPVPR